MSKEEAFKELLDYIKIAKSGEWQLGYRDEKCYFQFNEKYLYFDVDYRIRDILTKKYFIPYNDIKQFIYKELLKHPKFKKIKYVVRFCNLGSLDNRFEYWNEDGK